ncbi:hypothetical protein F2K82_12640 [Vibrio cholerae]|uniref:hypothetical protein n=1 Tax=Vibrio TaxID=662 RepID=UPI000E68A433|nr:MULTISPECIES: hypothetical protein [Vibrio]EGQ9631061.1 hypothetical protein [Vibrio cholerae]EGQ9638263.1 hypothetical protein [Vibrio cholerae]EGR0776955.1 hypothetical protein [Vibrio cholerae]EGR0780738.1 hypothetical protein [Vibrio cholerae]EGR0823026.1 hypothetical protein [Vibrio cholerae]
MAETSNIAVVAEKVSQDLFKWFKWEMVDAKDLNFSCHKGSKHTTSKESKLTHPVDVVFKYKDPYQGKYILFNTDLKSYAKGSINTSSIRDALTSLAYTIDCAEGSQEWQNRYALGLTNYEIRGMLFVYNHDGQYKTDFYDLFKAKINPKSGRLGGGINLSNIPLREGQKIHIIEPKVITYMRTIISDMDKLHRERTFPEKAYSFYYPDLLQHKLKGDTSEHPATIELICGPYMIIKHNAVKKWDEEKNRAVETYQQGYVIYYNQTGENPFEFIYLFDLLSNLQILRTKDDKIRIRVAHKNPFNDIRSNYEAAVAMYTTSLGGDKYKAEILRSIEFSIIEQTKDIFCITNIGWERSE